MLKKLLALVLMFAAIPALAWGSGRGGGFLAHLSGGEVVPPVKSAAQGYANFELHPNGQSLRVNLTVKDLANITAAAIYLGAAGQKGTVVVQLFPGKQTPAGKAGNFSGALVAKIITVADLEGPLKGKSLGDLAKEFRVGNAYIQVLTQENPGGALRGKITWRPT